MDTNNTYYRQVLLLTRVLPLVATQKCFALKGGTAINLFFRDLPRLSVDIDLVYLPMDEREGALANITDALNRISKRVSKAFPGIRIQKSFESQADALRMTIRQDDIQIKIELSPVLRGSVFPEVIMGVTKTVEEQFGYAEMQVLQLPDLYAGKLCAALDRQHPRDLFDVKFLLENEGISDDLRKTFLVYLISHNRTMAELLRPNLKDIRSVYEGEFLSMARTDVSVEELECVRTKMIEGINTALTQKEKDFLISFKSLSPDWSLLGLKNIDRLPAVRWKMFNLSRMNKDKHHKTLSDLKRVLHQE